MKLHDGESRRGFIKKIGTFSIIIPGAVNSACRSKVEEENTSFKIPSFKKIDVHTHISSDAVYLREVMDSLNLKMFTICNEGLKTDRLKAQMEAAVKITRDLPRYYAWCTTFGFERMFEPDWAERVIAGLKQDFNNGALAVKVWKEIGMQVKNRDGLFIQIDDPIFDPILDFIAAEGKPLFIHVGDRVQQWLSVGSDGRQNGWYREDGGIWNRIGEFYGEVPYDQVMLARDRMVEKHPDLKVIGCHMACMCFDVDEIAKRLDKYSNFAVGTSYSLLNLMSQSRNKIRNFFTEYQDRILYGSDISGGMVATQYLVDMSKLGQEWTPEEVQEEKRILMEKYNGEFTYFMTDREISRGDYSIHGLDLAEDVLKKLFYQNAVNWVPGIDREFSP